jgi:endonuclease YncB( thermonuclease family)
LQRFLKRAGAILLLGLIFGLWLFPEWFGLSGGRPTRTIDGANIIIRDGDTLTIDKQDYRLHGIDAPEFTQMCKTAAGVDWLCGKQARTELVALLKDRSLNCEERARDKYQRVVATCTDDKGNDVARLMVERGLAVSFGGFAEGPYAFEESQAKAARRGLWQGAFEPPASWRSAHPRAPVANR